MSIGVSVRSQLCSGIRCRHHQLAVSIYPECTQERVHMRGTHERVLLR